MWAVAPCHTKLVADSVREPPSFQRGVSTDLKGHHGDGIQFGDTRRNVLPVNGSDAGGLSRGGGGICRGLRGVGGG